MDMGKVFQQDVGTLHLFCSCTYKNKAHWHFVPGEKGHEITELRQWAQDVAPVMSSVLGIVKAVAGLGQWLGIPFPGLTSMTEAVAGGAKDMLDNSSARSKGAHGMRAYLTQEHSAYGHVTTPERRVIDKTADLSTEYCNESVKKLKDPQAREEMMRAMKEHHHTKTYETGKVNLEPRYTATAARRLEAFFKANHVDDTLGGLVKVILRHPGPLGKAGEVHWMCEYHAKQHEVHGNTENFPDPAKDEAHIHSLKMNHMNSKFK
jgi:hypothetical protein